jgi:hypothetical protein
MKKTESKKGAIPCGGPRGCRAVKTCTWFVTSSYGSRQNDSDSTQVLDGVGNLDRRTPDEDKTVVDVQAGGNGRNELRAEDSLDDELLHIRSVQIR